MQQIHPWITISTNHLFSFCKISSHTNFFISIFHPGPLLFYCRYFVKPCYQRFHRNPRYFVFFASPSPLIRMINWPLTLVHCCTMSLCYLGAEMIITEIQISIQRSSRWATNYTPGPQLFLFCKLTVLFHRDPTHSHSIAFLPPCSPLWSIVNPRGPRLFLFCQLQSSRSYSHSWYCFLPPSRSIQKASPLMRVE